MQVRIKNVCSLSLDIVHYLSSRACVGGVLFFVVVVV